MADEDDWGDSRLSGNTEAPRRKRSVPISEGRVGAAKEQRQGYSRYRPRSDERYERHVSKGRQLIEEQRRQEAEKKQHEEEEAQKELERLQSEEEMQKQMQVYKNAEAGVKMTRPTPTRRRPTPAPAPPVSSPRRTGGMVPLDERIRTQDMYGGERVFGKPSKPKQDARKKTSKVILPAKVQNATTTRARGKDGRFLPKTASKAKPKAAKKTATTGKLVGVVADGKGARGIKTGKKVKVVSEFKGEEASSVVKTSKELEKRRAQETVATEAKLKKQREEAKAKRETAKQKRASRPTTTTTTPRDARGKFIAPTGKKAKPKVLSPKEFEKKDSEFFDEQKRKLDNGEISQDTYNRYIRARKKHYLDTHPKAREEPSYHMVIKYQTTATAAYGEHEPGEKMDVYFSVSGAKKPRMSKKEMRDLAMRHARKSGLVVTKVEVVLTRDEWTGVKL